MTMMSSKKANTTMDMYARSFIFRSTVHWGDLFKGNIGYGPNGIKGGGGGPIRPSNKCGNPPFSIRFKSSCKQIEKIEIKLKICYRPNSPGPLMDYWKVTDDSSVNFHDKFFLHFMLKFSRKWRKNLSWKCMGESSVTFQSSVSGPGKFGLSQLEEN